MSQRRRPQDGGVFAEGDISMSESGIKTGRYRHFKGNEYIVTGIARHSETLEELVIYQDVHDASKIWARPAAMWNETVERDGKIFKRFEYIGE